MRRSFEQLTVWQKAMDLVILAYDAARRLPAAERFGLAAQLRRSAVSIPSNIAEGHGRLHSADFARHLSIASGSLRELHTQVLIALRLEMIDPDRARALSEAADEVGRMLAGLIGAVRRYRKA